MTLQTAQDMLQAQPFVPFRVTMSSGESFEVRHPEMAWLTRTNLFVGLDMTEEGVPERSRILALLHVTALEPLEPIANRTPTTE